MPPTWRTNSSRCSTAWNVRTAAAMAWRATPVRAAAMEAASTLSTLCRPRMGTSDDGIQELAGRHEDLAIEHQVVAGQAGAGRHVARAAEPRDGGGGTGRVGYAY